VLVIDVIDFRPLITLTEDGEVSGIKSLKHPETGDLLTDFLRDPNAFVQFLHEDLKETDKIFIFHLQSINSVLHCSMVHV
jgi:hypothetical protein